ncbi:hypothetical protein [Aurantimonas sp. Leaf443]|uniref:hypothetical protein n=1 Tax=Aurantimonas sp. Leaf443 TaxID=1736378 RepID=UPI0006F7C758|nr:hypothetical protein [Aurantimonas sp. Leaf443]KQT85501.1 hypothetical protein ASG48_09805 [Aurantimonas sp. Leaf443]
MTHLTALAAAAALLVTALPASAECMRNSVTAEAPMTPIVTADAGTDTPPALPVPAEGAKPETRG